MTDTKPMPTNIGYLKIKEGEDDKYVANLGLDTVKLDDGREFSKVKVSFDKEFLQNAIKNQEAWKKNHFDFNLVKGFKIVKEDETTEDKNEMPF